MKRSINEPLTETPLPAASIEFLICTRPLAKFVLVTKKNPGPTANAPFTEIVELRMLTAEWAPHRFGTEGSCQRRRGENIPGLAGFSSEVSMFFLCVIFSCFFLTVYRSRFTLIASRGRCIPG